MPGVLGFVEQERSVLRLKSYSCTKWVAVAANRWFLGSLLSIHKPLGFPPVEGCGERGAFHGERLWGLRLSAAVRRWGLWENVLRHGSFVGCWNGAGLTESGSKNEVHSRKRSRSQPIRMPRFSFQRKQRTTCCSCFKSFPVLAKKTTTKKGETIRMSSQRAVTRWFLWWQQWRQCFEKMPCVFSKRTALYRYKF